MSLFLVVTIICLLLTIASDLMGYIKLSRLFAGGNLSKNGLLDLYTAMFEAKAELKRLQDRSIKMGEYTRKIKIIRAERKVEMKEALLSDYKKNEDIALQQCDKKIGYIVRIGLYLTLTLILFVNRSQPVVIFDDSINLQPFTGLISFPTGIRNGVSVWIWTLSSNVSFRLFYDLVKTRFFLTKQ